MVSVGNGDRVVMHVSSGRGRGLTQVGSASKFLREMRACYFWRRIRSPGSEELMESKVPCASRVV